VAVVQTILWFILALVVLVAVHEFGHFYIARRCGVRVLRFSIGFGKVLFSRRDRHGTEFAVSAIPLGGYVKMLDEREGGVPQDQLHFSFTRKTVWQRMAIVVAGPVANFILAILLYWALLLGGERDIAPIVGTVESGSIAAHAGLDVGQEILSVDGEPTPTRQALYQQLLRRLGESGAMRFSLRYPESNLEYQSEITLDKWLQGQENPDPLAGLGLTLFVPEASTHIEVIEAGSPAERGGFLAGDKLLGVDGTELTTARQWIGVVRANPGQPLTVELERAGRAITLSVTPESIVENGVSYGRVGMSMSAPVIPESMMRANEYSITGALLASLDKTWNTTGFVLLSVKKLLVGEISTKNLSGPVSIAKVAGSSAQGGLKSFVAFLALLSIFLGVFNLLPIPVLDGGHLLYYLIEAVKGSPVPEKIQMAGYQAGLFLVIGLSLLALYNDIMRL
jgi:regulator of sigma E protease